MVERTNSGDAVRIVNSAPHGSHSHSIRSPVIDPHRTCSLRHDGHNGTIMHRNSFRACHTLRRIPRTLSAKRRRPATVSS
jgi:hypothetical protein